MSGYLLLFAFLLIEVVIGFFTFPPPSSTTTSSRRSGIIVWGRYSIKPKWKKIQQGGEGPQVSMDWMEEEKRLEQEELQKMALEGQSFEEAVEEEEEEEEEQEGELIQTFVVEKKEAGQRLDRFLSHRIPEQSRTYLTGLISRGLVKVDRVAEAKSRKVLGGEEVRVRFVATPEIQLEAEDIPLTILYEDEDVLGLYKPASMVTHPAPGNWNGTVVNAVLGYLRAKGGPSSSSTNLEGVGTDGLRPGVVHRLDKGTSGVILIAKTPQSHAGLSDAFASRRVNKTYLAVTVGNPGTDVVMDNAIGRHPVDRQRMTVTPLGKEAKSIINTQAFDGKVAVVEVRIETGRTHQIRVHLQHRGTPVWGDPIYGKSQWNNRLKDRYGIDRPLLHAHKIEVPHPTKPQEAIRLVAPIPGDIARVLRAVYPQWQDQHPDWTLLGSDQGEGGQGDDHDSIGVQSDLAREQFNDKARKLEAVVDSSAPKEGNEGDTSTSTTTSTGTPNPTLLPDKLVEEMYGAEYLEYM